MARVEADFHCALLVPVPGKCSRQTPLKLSIGTIVVSTYPLII